MHHSVHIKRDTILALLASIYELVSFSLVACPVSFTVIGFEHSRGEELIGRDVLWEDITQP